MAESDDTHILLPSHEVEIADCLVSENSAMLASLQLADALAKQSVPVMFSGESGVGKSLMARYIHVRSHKKSRPCLNLRCQNLTGGEIKSRLFGGTAGAIASVPGGLLGSAAGGTLVLDGVDQMSGLAQKQLLRILQRYIPSPHGGRNERLGVRLLSTGGAGGDSGHIFNEELAYLLAEVTIRIPPLRDRREDILRLSLKALHLANKSLGKNVRKLSDSALDFLMHYGFPGNVRELFVLVNHAVGKSRRDTIYVEDFGLAMGEADGSGEVFVSGTLFPLAEMEKRHINRVLLRTGWKKNAAARILQITETMLNRKIKLYGLERHG